MKRPETWLRIHRFLALSDHFVARFCRQLRSRLREFSVPAPLWITYPVLVVLVGIRSAWFFFLRVFICEPLFKAYCTAWGTNVHTGAHLHWVTGTGRIILGDRVRIDGKCSFHFASRYDDHPTLTVGDGTGIGHGCAFVIGKSITIGRHCRIGQDVRVFDAPGHPTDPASRLAGNPAGDSDVRPVRIEDNVWIGTGAVLFPGVTIGNNSIVSLNAVVMADVPPNTIVAGNPARRIAALNTEQGARASDTAADRLP
jgi:acetyltransferase-like isoleucine patch superfamily enzyme